MSRSWTRRFADAAIWLVIAVLSAVAVIAFFGLAFLVFYANVTEASAHDAPSGWTYDSSCCSDSDCRPVPDSFVRETPNGYSIPSTGEIIPYGDERVLPSPDGQFHWCGRRGRDDIATFCLYAAPGAM